MHCSTVRCIKSSQESRVSTSTKEEAHGLGFTPQAVLMGETRGSGFPKPSDALGGDFTTDAGEPGGGASNPTSQDFEFSAFDSRRNDPDRPQGSGRARIRTPGTRDTAQASEVGSGWVCPECERAFTTKIGVGVHKRRAHPLTTNIDAAPAQIKRRWREEEVALLAKTEARLVREFVQCTNQELANKLPQTPQ
ncbi:unnamed protein product [Arctia plantaginis]|uniref:C2H2-type domain-containing protein n=1 Tax=Arctia plantaginis TaxID=874455 RepID=A0A8S1AN58_ARCPL|nr:unnamed protein product [Arctia plantaginis]